MTTRIRCYLFFISLLAGYGQLSQATPIVTVTDCSYNPSFSCISSVTNLSVNNMTFNASFIRTDFQSQWPDPTVIPQWGDATLAGALGLALLKSVENVVNRGACDTATLVGCTRNVFIPFDYFDNANTAVLLLQAFPEDGFLTGTTPNNVTSGGLYVDFAKVPEPTTLALLGLGIAGLGFRKKTQ